MKRTLNALLQVIITTTLILIVYVACSSIRTTVRPNLPKFGTPSNFSPAYNSVIRLTKDGNFYCTGFVIDGHYAITAGHCIGANFQGALPEDRVEIYSDNSIPTGIEARAAAFNSRIDVGLLEGDFTDFKPAKINTTTINYVSGPGNLVHLKACGFPQGQFALVCSDFYMTGVYGFNLMGMAFLIPGMSGGPVYDDTDTIVAVNSAMLPGGALVAPITGILAGFGIE